MDKAAQNPKNELYIVGSCYKVDQFKVVDALEGSSQNIKPINTGILMRDITHAMHLGSLEEISQLEHHRFVEPAMVKVISAHLEHSAVLLDTTYYYLTAGMSPMALQSLSKYISRAGFILATQDPKKIERADYKSENAWYKYPSNVKENLYANRAIFRSYGDIFTDLQVPHRMLEVDVDENSESLETRIHEFVSQVKSIPKAR